MCSLEHMSIEFHSVFSNFFNFVSEYNESEAGENRNLTLKIFKPKKNLNHNVFTGDSLSMNQYSVERKVMRKRNIISW